MKKILAIVGILVVLTMTTLTAFADTSSDNNNAVYMTPYGYRTAKLYFYGSESFDYGILSNNRIAYSTGSDYTFKSYLTAPNYQDITASDMTVSSLYSVISGDPTRVVVTNRTNVPLQRVTLYYPELIYGTSEYTNVGELILGDVQYWNALNPGITFGIQLIGNVTYPILDGGTIDIPIELYQTLSYDSGKTPRVMVRPARMHPNGNPLEYYDVFQIAWDNVDSDVQSTLVPLEYLDRDVVRLTDYQVTMTTSEPISCFVTNEPVTINGLPYEDFSTADFFSQNLKITIVNELERVNVVEWITDIFSGLLDVQIFPNFYLYHCVAVIVAISLIIWILKVFAGG